MVLNNNNNNSSSENVLQFLQEYQSLNNKKAITEEKIAAEYEAQNKYRNIHRLYELSDVFSRIAVFMTEVDIPNYDNWNNHIGSCKEPVSRYCSEAFIMDGFHYVEFDLVKVLKDVQEQLANLNVNNPGALPVVGMGNPQLDRAQILKDGIKAALGFDPENAPNMVEQNQEEMNEIQLLIRERHAYLDRKIDILKSKKKDLLKTHSSLLNSIQTPNSVTLTCEGSNPIVLGLINMGSSFLKLVPIEVKEEEGNQKALKVAGDQLNYSTKNEINPKLAKAEKEFGILSKFVSVLDEVFQLALCFC